MKDISAYEMKLDQGEIRDDTYIYMQYHPLVKSTKKIRSRIPQQRLTRAGDLVGMFEPIEMLSLEKTFSKRQVFF